MAMKRTQAYNPAPGAFFVAAAAAVELKGVVNAAIVLRVPGQVIDLNRAGIDPLVPVDRVTSHCGHSPRRAHPRQLDLVCNDWHRGPVLVDGCVVGGMLRPDLDGPAGDLTRLSRSLRPTETPGEYFMGSMSRLLRTGVWREESYVLYPTQLSEGENAEPRAVLLERPGGPSFPRFGRRNAPCLNEENR